MLNVFPQGLEGTLVIPVVLGVLVTAAFTEAWGWDFVGVVVPGYVASLLLLDPVVAAVVLAEAILTWAAAIGLYRLLTRTGVAFPVFGRDRFYLVLACSVGVRLGCEGFLLPVLAGRAASVWPALQARQHELFGVGLVLVPLTANRLWRPGVGRGLFQLGVEAAVVAAIVRGVLMSAHELLIVGVRSLLRSDGAGVSHFSRHADRAAGDGGRGEPPEPPLWLGLSRHPLPALLALTALRQ